MKKYLVIGNPIDHSLSPKLHNHWFKENNIDATYDKKKLSENDIEGVITEVKNGKIDGINVTVPFKRSVIPFLDYLSPTVKKTQSVNTIYKKGDQVIGDNTDVDGFVASLEYHKIGLHNARVLILGAGGVVPSIIVALQKMKVSNITISNRTRKKVEELEINYPINIKDWPIKNVEHFHLVINATSLGLNPGQEHSQDDLDKINIPANTIDLLGIPLFYDLIYNPSETFLLSRARTLGKKTINGKMMFIYQARLAFELWHKILPKVNDETFKIFD